MELKTDRMIAEKDGGLGWMIYNNPERRNAVSLLMREAAAQIYEAYAKDDDVRVLVIKGAGDKSFVSGADISEFKDKRQDAKAEEAYGAAVKRSLQAVEAFDKPVIAMIQGYCIGGGVNVALEADIRIAADNSIFAVPAARLGLGYGYGGLKRLVDVVGPAYAKEILFTGRRFDAAQALAMGLVNCVVPVDELEDTVRQYAADIAAHAPLTIEAAKAADRPVFAANSPRRYLKVGREGYEAYDVFTDEQRRLFAVPDEMPGGSYREDFMELMGGMSGSHGGDEAPELTDEEIKARLEASFRSQSIWDATMSDTVARAVADGYGPVVLVIGNFHVKNHGGTVQLFERALPDASYIVVLVTDGSGDELDEEDVGSADFVLYVGEEQ